MFWAQQIFGGFLINYYLLDLNCKTVDYIESLLDFQCISEFRVA